MTDADDVSDDELDFFDFIEVVANKIDSITQQIEERKEDSLQKWKQTRDEVEKQKQLLKVKFEKQIHLISTNFKKSSFTRARHKITFSIGVANTCLLPLIAVQWPHLLPMVYTIQACCLIPIRIFDYRRKRWHYSIFDLCYYVNLLLLIYLWILPSSKILFVACYSLTHGPLAFAVFFWKNALVFHSIDKIISLIIHIYPALTMFTLRWILPTDYQLKHYPAIVNIGPKLPFFTTLFYTVAVYLIWQLLFSIFIVHGRKQKVASGSRVTSYTWMLSDETSFVSRVAQKLGFGAPNDEINRPRIFVYFLMQFCYMFISVLPVSLCYYQYIYINLAFLCVVFAASVYNGASFYIDVFSQQYIKSLEALHEWDDSHAVADANNTKKNT